MELQIALKVTSNFDANYLSGRHGRFGLPSTMGAALQSPMSLISVNFRTLCCYC